MKKEKLKVYPIRLRPEDYEKLKKKAEDMGVSVSFVVKVLIHDFVRNTKKITVGGEL